MNKYQEALDYLRRIGGDGYYKKQREKSFDVLQELVDKATPKKPIGDLDLPNMTGQNQLGPNKGGSQMTQKYNVYIIGDIVHGKFMPLENRTYKHLANAKNRLETLRQTRKRFHNARLYCANNWEEVEAGNNYEEALNYFLDREEGENITVTGDWLLYAEELKALVSLLKEKEE